MFNYSLLQNLKLVDCCVIQTMKPGVYFEPNIKPVNLEVELLAPGKSLKSSMGVRYKTLESKKRCLKSVALALNHLVTNGLA